MSKKSIEDNQSGINLCLVLSLNEGKQLVEQVLPNESVLFGNHGTLNFHSNIANFVNQSFVSGINTSQSLQNNSLHSFACRVCQALPQILIVVLVLQVLGVHLRADIASQDDSCEALCFDGNLSLIWALFHRNPAIPTSDSDSS